jgi:hypothetical protein
MSNSQNLEDFLLLEMSRRNTDLVADLICQNHELFAALFQIYLRNEEPVSRRAAWVIDTVTENYPELIAPHLGKMIEMLPEFHHDGLKRHSLRMLARSPFPPGDDLGKMISICFDWLLSPSESVSVKVYSMEILYRISQVEPDMKKELADSIEWRMNEETAGFRNRGQKLLKKLYMELK